MLRRLPLLNSKSLRSALLKIFDIDEKYLIPLNDGWFVPTSLPEEIVGTWIGYRINSIRPYARAYASGATFVKPVKISFRITFIGTDAEDLALQTMFWEDRSDVTDVFEKEYLTQINYNERQVYSYPVKNKGFNDYLSWVADFTAQTTLDIATKWKPWIRR